MVIGNKTELESLKVGGKILATILKKLSQASLPGVKTKELDELAQELISKFGAKPAFLGYKPDFANSSYPACISTSINEEIVHGLPSERRLKNGDILSIDLGIKYDDLYTDAAFTIPIGRISKEAKKLLDTTKKSLDKAIRDIKPKKTIGDIGYSIQKFITKAGFSVIRDLTGHGVGEAPHEPPDVPNFGRQGDGLELIEGLVIALEPMASIGSERIRVGSDGWTISTRDKSLSAHFEKTIVVTKTGCEALTPLEVW